MLEPYKTRQGLIEIALADKTESKDENLTLRLSSSALRFCIRTGIVLLLLLGLLRPQRPSGPRRRSSPRKSSLPGRTLTQVFSLLLFSLGGAGRLFALSIFVLLLVERNSLDLSFCGFSGLKLPPIFLLASVWLQLHWPSTCKQCT